MSHPDYSPSGSSQRPGTSAGDNGDAAPAENISERLGSLKFDKSQFVPTARYDAAPRNYRPWIASSAGVVVVLVLLGFGWSAMRPRILAQQVVAGQADGSPAEVFAVTAVANGGGDGPRLSISGYVVAESKVQVPVKVTGTVVDLPIVEGMKVSAGDLLVKLDSQEYEIELKQAEASVKVAKRGTKSCCNRGPRKWSKPAPTSTSPSAGRAGGKRSGSLRAIGRFAVGL